MTGKDLARNLPRARGELDAGGPQFVFVGLNKPGGQVRLYASRTFEAHPEWGWQDTVSGPAIWTLGARLAKVLVVDAAGWPEAMARVFEIWANEDAETARRQLEMEQRCERDRIERAALKPGFSTGNALE